MDDWLSEEHLARFVVDIVEQLDLTVIKGNYAGRGYKARHPAMLLVPAVLWLCHRFLSQP
jgi:transposase